MINVITIFKNIEIISTLSKIFDNDPEINVSFIQINDIKKKLFENSEINIVIFIDLIPEQENKLILQTIDSKKIPILFIIKAEQISNMPIETIYDNFMLYPINHTVELLFRIKRLALKNTNNLTNPNYFKLGNLTINFDRYEISINKKNLSLTYKEYQLIVLLATSPGKVYSREILLDNIWSYDYVGGTRTVDVHIRRIRSKLENALSTAKIETIWNVGYKIET
tara:strand:+ start:253 stop:924 length:672 start_codon:yes stop_codon:yes gene_type:complete